MPGTVKSERPYAERLSATFAESGSIEPAVAFDFTGLNNLAPPDGRLVGLIEGFPPLANGDIPLSDVVTLHPVNLAFGPGLEVIFSPTPREAVVSRPPAPEPTRPASRRLETSRT